MKPLIYLDYCATTPIHADVREAILETLGDHFGNPSSMHQFGINAAQKMTNARTIVAAGLGCNQDELYFTSGATEADNLALFGIMHQYDPQNAHLITTSIEHHAVLHAAYQLKREGYGLTVVPVDATGFVDPQEVEKAIKPSTKLVSVMMVNNEVGSIQNLNRIGEITSSHQVLFHTDAVQGMGLMDIDLDGWHIDLLSLSAHKIYGPKGAGALYIRDGVTIKPMFHGGSQEKAIRPGTENIPGVVGLGEALRLVARNKTTEKARLSKLKAWFIDELQNNIPGISINSLDETSPHILSVSFPGAIAEMMQYKLNKAGIAISLGSACTSKEVEPSHVLVAMGFPHEKIEGTIRFSFGNDTTNEVLEKVLALLPEIWQRSCF